MATISQFGLEPQVPFGTRQMQQEVLHLRLIRLALQQFRWPGC